MNRDQRKAVLAGPGVLVLLVSGGCAANGPEVEDGSGPAPQVTAQTYDQYDGLFAEWRDSFVECARSVGLDASVTEDGEGIISGSSEDRPRHESGLDLECIERTGAPPEAPPLTQETLSGLYDLSVQQAECLKVNGYPVSAPPSREAWMESYETEPIWLPLDAVMSSDSDVSAAVRACPDPDPADISP